ncbi:MAG TPA: carboxypeptidase-like regulatory domain-containing protein [Myxococcales bacterium]|jgi:hypothetical protein|nr:carboxypeptidase-like regulatory domain-containing protein [Myxococcales bacterium]
MTSDGEALAQASKSADAKFRADAPTVPMTSCRSTDWIDFRLVDGTGKPIPGIRFRLDSTDGKSAEGVTDEDGCAGAEGLDPGKCRITWLPAKE